MPALDFLIGSPVEFRSKSRKPMMNCVQRGAIMAAVVLCLFGDSMAARITPPLSRGSPPRLEALSGVDGDTFASGAAFVQTERSDMMAPLAAPQKEEDIRGFVARHRTAGAALLGTGVKPADAETCKKVTELVKKESKAESGECKLVVPGTGAAPDGCECHMMGFEEFTGGCPFDCSGEEKFHDCVEKPLKDLGINKVSSMGAVSFPEMGSAKGANCMYWAWMENPFTDDVDQRQKNGEASRANVLSYVKTANEWSGAIAKGAAGALWGLTMGPWPVDKYGTPNCFGLCTTPNMTYWNAASKPAGGSTTTTTTTTIGGRLQ